MAIYTYALPNEACLLSELGYQAVLLGQNNFYRAEVLQQRVSLEFEKVTREKRHDFTSNAVSRRIAQLEQSHLNAQDVQLEESRYLLFACPENASQARDLFEAALVSNSTLFVTLMKSDDGYHFWKQEKLSQCTTLSGWTFTNFSSVVLYVGKSGSLDQSTTTLVKTTFTAVKGEEKRSLTHLHLDGWEDQCAPNEEAFIKLLDFVDQMQPTGPIAVNCVAGIGRSGTFALSNHVRNHIRRRMTTENLKEIRINILEMLCGFRQQREGLMNSPDQLYCVYSVTAVFVTIMLKGVLSTVRLHSGQKKEALQSRLAALEYEALLQELEGHKRASCLPSENRLRIKDTNYLFMTESFKATEVEPSDMEFTLVNTSTLYAQETEDDFTVVLKSPLDTMLEFLDTVIDKEVEVFVTASAIPTDLLCITRFGAATNKGWKITKEKIIKHENGLLIETQFLATKSYHTRQFRNYHILGWDGTTQVPNPQLFHHLLVQLKQFHFWVQPLVISMQNPMSGYLIAALDVLQKDRVDSCTVGQLEARIIDTLTHFQARTNFVPDQSFLREVHRLFFEFV